MATNDATAGANALVQQARQMLENGDWQGALRLLHRARRERADDPTVHALIGDCYVAAERWHRAVAAYEQSLELAYDADVAQRLQVAREQAARSPAPTFDVQPRTLAIVAAAVVLAAAAVGIMLWATAGSRAAKSSGPAGPAGTPQAMLTPPSGTGTGRAGAPTSPWQMPSAAPPAAGVAQRQQAAQAQAPATTAGGQQAQSSAPANMPPVRITKRVDAPATDRDYYLTDIIGSLSWPDGSPLAGNCLVQFDPYTGYAFVTITIPRSMRATNLAQVTLRMAQGVAWALFKADRSVKYVTVRALYAIQQPARRANTVVAFRGNTSRVAYEYWQRLGRQPNIQELWSDVFATCWWNPNVSAATEPKHR